MKRETALRHNLNRVVNFVQLNCGSAVDLEQMADIAHLSKYHFTRVFQQYIHETPYRYLYRTRLEYAARCLIYHPGRSITEIAMESGFTDTQAFSNAFRNRFRLSPRSFRSDDEHVVERVELPKSLGEKLAKTPINVVNKPAMRLAYVRNLGPYLDIDGGITRVSDQIIDWATQRGLWSRATEYVGVCPSNPLLTPPGFCIYDAGIVVPEEIGEDETVSIQNIPAGRYAVMRVDCPAKYLNVAWNQFFRWIHRSGESYAMEHCYEIVYGYDTADEVMDLCLRLLPRYVA